MAIPAVHVYMIGRYGIAGREDGPKASKSSEGSMARKQTGAGTHIDVAVEEQPDAEQLRLDLEDARQRIGRLRDAIRKKEEAELEVRRLQAQLKQARRKVKEAGWDVSLLLERAKGG